jgi:Flp pilus assembly protein TadG
MCCLRLVARGLRDNRGNIATMFALSIFPMMIGIGSVIDYSRAVTLHQKLQQATDAAILATALMPSGSTQQQFLANASAFLSVNVNDPSAVVSSLTVSPDHTTLQMTTSAVLKTAFAQILGVPSIPVSAAASTAFPDNSYEVALVLDNTASMSNSAGGASKMQAAQTTANTFIDTMLSGSTGAGVKIAVLPFTTAINVGPSYSNASWIDSNGQSSIHWTHFNRTLNGNTGWTPKSRFDIFKQFSPLGVSWTGCLETRPGSWATTDAPPDPTQPDSYFVPLLAPDEPGSKSAINYTIPNGPTYQYLNSYIADNPSYCTGASATTLAEVANAQDKTCKYYKVAAMHANNKNGPNFGCDVPPLTRLTSDAPTLHSAINAMSADGNTNILEAFTWGWRLLSPNIPFSDGKPYGTSSNYKILVLMTDGFNFWPTATNHDGSTYISLGYFGDNRIGTGVVDETSARALMDQRTLEACTNAKNSGVIVYTVGFSVPNDPIDAQGLQLLQNCGSDATRAFTATDQASFLAAFNAIANQIRILRLTL